jgi:hypothetical protein
MSRSEKKRRPDILDLTAFSARELAWFGIRAEPCIRVAFGAKKGRTTKRKVAKGAGKKRAKS